MRQRAIIKEIAEKHDLTQSEIKELLDLFSTEFRNTIFAKQPIYIEEFGTFQPSFKKQKITSVPGKSEKVVIKAHYKLDFEIHKKLKELVHGVSQ